MNVYYFSFHTVTVWAFTRDAIDLARKVIIDEWAYNHSPAEAVSNIRQCDWHFIDRSDVHASTYIVAYFVKEPTRCHTVTEPEWRVDRAFDDLGKAKGRAIALSRYSRGRVITAQQ